MIYGDRAIGLLQNSGAINIRPWSDEQLNPASYDLLLGKELLVRPMYQAPPLDLFNISGDEYLHPLRFSTYTIKPGEFLLASTEEYVTLSDQVVGRVEGKSSLARVGLAVHVTGGFIDPGFYGTITLEMVNLLHRPLVLYPGMRIAQIAFSPVEGRINRPYSQTGHYQGQNGPTLSRYRSD